MCGLFTWMFLSVLMAESHHFAVNSLSATVGVCTYATYEQKGDCTADIFPIEVFIHSSHVYIHNH